MTLYTLVLNGGGLSDEHVLYISSWRPSAESRLIPHFVSTLVTVLHMTRKRILVACTAVVLVTVVGSGSVSADESVPVPTTTTVVEESGLIFSQVDDHTIEVSVPVKTFE